MPAPSIECARLAERYALALPRRLPQGAAGERLGRGAGASLEFHDHRAYAPGDDLRHLDWRAYARTGQLHVRRHVEELRPRCELLLDVSASMASDPAKAQLALDLAALFAMSARRAGSDVRVLALGERALPLELEHFLGAELAFTARDALAEAARQARPQLAAGGLRYLFSDLLEPVDPRALVTELSRGAGRFALVQMLSPEDAAPSVRGSARLVDAESAAELELEASAAVLARYAARLARLIDAYALETRRAGGLHARLVAGPPLEEHCRARLLPEGFLLPR